MQVDQRRRSTDYYEVLRDDPDEAEALLGVC